MAHARNGCSQSSCFPTAGQGERSSGNEIERDWDTKKTNIENIEILKASLPCQNTDISNDFETRVALKMKQ